MLADLWGELKYLILFSLQVLPIADCMAHEEKRAAIQRCTESQKGIDLIIANGNRTQERINPLYFVPAIEINEVRTLFYL